MCTSRDIAWTVQSANPRSPTLSCVCCSSKADGLCTLPLQLCHFVQTPLATSSGCAVSSCTPLPSPPHVQRNDWSCADPPQIHVHLCCVWQRPRRVRSGRGRTGWCVCVCVWVCVGVCVCVAVLLVHTESLKCCVAVHCRLLDNWKFTHCDVTPVDLFPDTVLDASNVSDTRSHLSLSGFAGTQRTARPV